jgi:hypothetical protein
VLPRRLVRSAIVLKPSSLLNFHHALVHRKYRLLFSARRRTRPGPKGPSADLMRAVVEMKQRNSRWGCPRIAEQMALAFGMDINKDLVRRILAAHYQLPADRSGPSWLTFLGHAKDSLHSIDLFRCESVALRTYWVLVVMDQYTRRIIGFGVHRGIVDGVELCRMFNRAIRGQTVPKYLSSDHDPVSISSMAGEPSGARRHGDQNCALRADVTSIRRATYWNHSSRVLRRRAVLDSCRFRIEAIGVHGRLQFASKSRRSRRQNTGGTS